MHSCGLALPFPKQGFHVSHSPGRGRLVIEPRTKVRMTFPETGPGQIHGRSQLLALAPPAHLTSLRRPSILSSSASSGCSTLQGLVFSESSPPAVSVILDYREEENHPRTPPPHPETLSKFECGVQFMSVLNKTLVSFITSTERLHPWSDEPHLECVCIA